METEHRTEQLCETVSIRNTYNLETKHLNHEHLSEQNTIGTDRFEKQNRAEQLKNKPRIMPSRCIRTNPQVDQNPMRRTNFRSKHISLAKSRTRIRTSKYAMRCCRCIFLNKTWPKTIFFEQSLNRF